MIEEQKFLTNPLVWVLIIGIVAFGGYQLLNRPTEKLENSQTAKTQAVQPSPQAQAKALGNFKKVSDTTVTLENKPYFLYVGAQFCPFCAAERWSIVKALANFGTWSGLKGDTSGSYTAGGFSQIPTYDFTGVAYQSSYIAFGHKETADKNGKPIAGQELTDFEKQWNDTYNPKGGVPFLFIDGKYVQQSAGFSPGLLSGKIYDQVKADVDSNANTPYVQAINREADIITAYLCKATNNQPTNVCSDTKITELIVQVP